MSSANLLSFKVQWRGGNDYLSPAGDYSSLVKVKEGWIRTMKDGLKYYFNSLGYLTAEVDRNNNTTTYQYDSNWKILKIINPMGRDTSFVYGSDDMLDSITYPEGRTFRYEHNSEGQLTAIVRPDNSRS